MGGIISRRQRPSQDSDAKRPSQAHSAVDASVGMVLFNIPHKRMYVLWQSDYGHREEDETEGMWRGRGAVNVFLNVMGVSVYEYLAQTASMPHIVAVYVLRSCESPKNCLATKCTAY